MYSINRALSRLKIHIPKVKTIISSTEFIEDTSCETAYTDGKKVYYNPEYLSSLSLSEQEFIICHELLHIIFDHISRWNNRNGELWNYATDAVINQILIDNGLTIPPGLIECPDAINYTAEEYYDYMLKNPNLEKELANYRHSKASTHSRWVKEPADKTKQGDSEKKEVNEKEFNRQNKEMVKKEAQSYVENVSEQAKKMGGFTSEEIGQAREVINWHSLLNILKRKVISGDYDFFHGFFDEEGIYQYPYSVKRICPVEILIDTSGSVNDDLVKAFLRECKNILDEVPIDIGCFDTRFYGFQRITNIKDIENFKIEGRGGTDFDIAVDSFTSKAKLKIIFTDGMANMPKKTDNIYWFVYSNIKIDPPGGKVIYVNEEELIKRGKSI